MSRGALFVKDGRLFLLLDIQGDFSYSCPKAIAYQKMMIRNREGEKCRH